MPAGRELTAMVRQGQPSGGQLTMQVRNDTKPTALSVYTRRIQVMSRDDASRFVSDRRLEKERDWLRSIARALGARVRDGDEVHASLARAWKAWQKRAAAGARLSKASLYWSIRTQYKKLDRHVREQLKSYHEEIAP